jgi:hypothetical protein
MFDEWLFLGLGITLAGYIPQGLSLVNAWSIANAFVSGHGYFASFQILVLMLYWWKPSEESLRDAISVTLLYQSKVEKEQHREAMKSLDFSDSNWGLFRLCTVIKKADREYTSESSIIGTTFLGMFGCWRAVKNAEYIQKFFDRAKEQKKQE